MHCIGLFSIWTACTRSIVHNFVVQCDSCRHVPWNQYAKFVNVICGHRSDQAIDGSLCWFYETTMANLICISWISSKTSGACVCACTVFPSMVFMAYRYLLTTSSCEKLLRYFSQSKNNKIRNKFRREIPHSGCTNSSAPLTMTANCMAHMPHVTYIANNKSMSKRQILFNSFGGKVIENFLNPFICYWERSSEWLKSMKFQYA